MIDWKLATTVAEGIANLKPAPEGSAFEHVAGPTEESVRLVSAYTGLMADSLMGVIAVIRQELLDAGHYKQEWDRYNATPRGYRRPEPSDDMDALPTDRSCMVVDSCRPLHVQ